MKIIRDITDMQETSLGWRRRGLSVGFVPTMGALHAGHVSLIRGARRDVQKVVVSIFVNPLQFGPKEDLGNYPRCLARDTRICRDNPVDILFLPSLEQMYPVGYSLYIDLGGLTGQLCGKFRPGHFKGMTTVVAKLLNIVAPSVLYLGQKDAQQARVIQKMVRDLNIPVTVKVMPTVREMDGLALSSRNRYLSKDERLRAIVLYNALSLAKEMIENGETAAAAVILRMKALIQKSSRVKVQYVSIVDTQSLKPVKNIRGRVLVALAVWIGKTRMIDNMVIASSPDGFRSLRVIETVSQFI